MQPDATDRGDAAPGHGAPGKPGRTEHEGMRKGGDTDDAYGHDADVEALDLRGASGSTDGDLDSGIDETGVVELPGAIADLDAVGRVRDDRPLADTQGHLALVAFKTLGAFLLCGLVALTLIVALGKPGEAILEFLKFSLVPLFGLITFIAGYFFGKRSNIE